MKNKEIKLIPMVQYILDIDWMTTSEFCKAFGLENPKFLGVVEAAVQEFMQIEAIKAKMFIEYAKLLNKPLSDNVLENLGFGLSPKNQTNYVEFINGTYTIRRYGYSGSGYILLCHSLADEVRVSKLEDLAGLGLTYTE